MGNFIDYILTKPCRLHVLLISSGQTYGTDKAVAKKTANKMDCNLSCLRHDIYKMEDYFYSIGANVSTHHNNAPTISEAKRWIAKFLKTALGEPKIIYFTGHGDINGNLCFDDGELSFEDVCGCGDLQMTVMIKDCCYAAKWGEVARLDRFVTVRDGSYVCRCPIICSSLRNQESFAKQDGSTFTKHLLTKLPKKSDFDATKDGMEWIKKVAYDDSFKKKFTEAQTSIITTAIYQKFSCNEKRMHRY